ncbi:zinc finger, CCHC-type containing protein [Tanacetum coccineum]
MHVFVGNFTYVIDFMIVEDINSIIDPRLSQVVLGTPFVKVSNMTHDPPEGVVRFTNGTDKIAYKMPHKIKQYNSLSDLEREHTKSVYLRNEEGKRKGVEYVMSKILGFYKECLELGPKYLTRIANEGEVTKSHLLGDKQIPSVGVFDEVFSIWKAFGGNTRDLGSFGEETDKHTNLHQHLSRISTQKLETASQITRDAVTTHLKTASQDLQTASDYLDSNVVVESRDVDFFENKFRHDSRSTNEIVNQISQDISSPDFNSNNKRNMTESSSAPRRSDNENNVIKKLPVLLNVKDAPKIYKEAITSRNSAFWKEAIDDEMDSLISNNTWELSDLPPGFSQRQGVDYFDTYAPVARITSIRVLFALASIYNFPIHQMDVKTAFLNGELDEEVYIKQPEGFVFLGHENKVCKLKKSLYGLKQSTKDYGVILCLYVDDILIVETNMEGINETKKFLSSCFQMKDMNEADTILGINIKRHKEANTPYESSWKLVENNGRDVSQIEYASAIGSLITRQLALYYDRFPVVLEGYSDASWMTGSSDSKSITGWIFTLNEGVVS